jgi:hypothetical protein
MSDDKTYIWYSSATDITGKNLQATLDITGGKTKPTGKKVVIGWGTKTKEDVSLPKGVKVLNHPNAIRLNRNKLEASRTMAEALNVNGTTKVARIATAETVKQDLADGAITFPMIGRKKYHQGGKGFWECPTVSQLDSALNAGAQYFQEMIPIKEEYRLHVFGDKVIHAVKKVKRTDKEYEKAFIEDELERQRILAEKNNNPFDEDMVTQVLKRQAKNAIAGGPNMVLRSNRLGWKFSIVKKYDDSLASLAVEAVKALGLDFGAVDCCINTDGNPYVFEVNSGPGLEGTSFDKYIEAFNEAMSADTVKTKVSKAIDNLTGSNTKKSVAAASAAGKKEVLAGQLQRFTEMIQEANEEEVDAVERMGKRLIFGISDD